MPGGSKSVRAVWQSPLSHACYISIDAGEWGDRVSGLPRRREATADSHSARTRRPVGREEKMNEHRSLEWGGGKESSDVLACQVLLDFYWRCAAWLLTESHSGANACH